jgi:hypothetical protein
MTILKYKKNSQWNDDMESAPYASAALEECLKSADFMTGPKWLKK